ncbi:MAG: hypothetical protein KDK39_20285, partial [Leptospiraceae bacterium]|nr:hypothetical protein [Leptospiraceae bacterium]
MKRILFFLLSLTLILHACRKEEQVAESRPASGFSYRIPMLWNQLYLRIERFCPGYKPPVSARNIALINLSAYETVVHGSK